jgi:hypothetical protein
MARQAAGFYLSVPVDGQVNPIIAALPDAATLDEAREDAIEAGHLAFVAAGYETMDMCYATLYRIAPNGGLAHSECFEVYGPEAL